MCGRALPFRQERLNLGLRPGERAQPEMIRVTTSGGAEPPPHIRRQSRNTVSKRQLSITNPRPTSRKKLIFKITVIVLALIVGWAAYDLYGPRTSHLREFDADEVARLETAMWRSYYEQQRLRLFNQLSELLRSQYNMPLIRSNRVAYYAADAAFVFKRGKQRSDYEKALPALIKFYESVRKISDIPFDVNRAAQIELEWWIINRERAKHPPGDLPRALAALQAEIYRVPVERLMEHALLRAEAMTIRDTKADEGGVTEADWARIDELLHRSWRSLSAAVKNS